MMTKRPIPTYASPLTKICLVAYSIRAMNRNNYQTPEGNPAEHPIEVHLEDMGGLRVFGDIWFVEAPPRARCSSSLSRRLRELLDPGDELLVVPIHRPDRARGVEINEALELLRAMHG